MTEVPSKFQTAVDTFERIGNIPTNFDAYDADVGRLDEIEYSDIMSGIEDDDVVLSMDLGEKLNLNAIAIAFGREDIAYEPEIFPGMFYYIEEVDVVYVLFGSGVVVSVAEADMYGSEGGDRASEYSQGFGRIVGDLVAEGLLQELDVEGEKVGEL